MTTAENWARLNFYVLNFLSILSDLPLTKETDAQKSWAILQNFKSWLIKLTINKFCQITKYQMFFLHNCKSYHSRLEVLQNSSAFFCLSFSGERKIWENWEGFFPEKPGPREVTSPNQELSTLRNFTPNYTHVCSSYSRGFVRPKLHH